MNEPYYLYYAFEDPGPMDYMVGPIQTWPELTEHVDFLFRHEQSYPYGVQNKAVADKVVAANPDSVVLYTREQSIQRFIQHDP